MSSLPQQLFGADPSDATSCLHSRDSGASQRERLGETRSAANLPANRHSRSREGEEVDTEESSFELSPEKEPSGRNAESQEANEDLEEAVALALDSGSGFFYSRRASEAPPGRGNRDCLSSSPDGPSQDQGFSLNSDTGPRIGSSLSFSNTNDPSCLSSSTSSRQLSPYIGGAPSSSFSSSSLPSSFSSSLPSSFSSSPPSPSLPS
ncbi:hypothetical protein TGMAS_294720A, partial [Toxoplasma gondii MAS]